MTNVDDRDRFLMKELEKLRGDDARRVFLGRHRELLRTDIVDRLSGSVIERVRVDAGAALALAQTSFFIATEIGDERARGAGHRGRAQVPA